MRDFSVILKELRNEKNISQAKVAAYLKITPRAVSFYETGERFPDFHGLIALADYFDVSIDYLVGRTDIRKKF